MADREQQEQWGHQVAVAVAVPVEWVETQHQPQRVAQAEQVQQTRSLAHQLHTQQAGADSEPLHQAAQLEQVQQTQATAAAVPLAVQVS
jgi:hypothetical protein